MARLDMIPDVRFDLPAAPGKAALASILLAAALIGCQDSASELASPRQCAQLREHVSELYVGQAAGLTIDEIDADAHARAFALSLGDTFIESCTTSYSARSVHCAIAADSGRALAACLPAVVETSAQTTPSGVLPDFGATPPALPIELAGDLDTAEK